MRTIQLTKGQVATVDEEDYAVLACHKWCAIRDGLTWYAIRFLRVPGERRSAILMHRQIFGASPGERLDHVNGDGLDNRRENLRLATNQQNLRNSCKRCGGSSRFKGVSWDKTARRWRARIHSGPKDQRGRAREVHLGLFDGEEAAAHAYDGAALASFGNFARLNFTPGK
jgi:hypothetical protein